MKALHIIEIPGGSLLETGKDLARLKTVAGWYAVESAADGTVTVVATKRGAKRPRFANLAPGVLLRNNPRLLRGQEVGNPAYRIPWWRFSGKGRSVADDARGWIVESVGADRKSLILCRDGLQSTASVADVVRFNLDELRTRIQVERDT